MKLGCSIRSSRPRAMPGLLGDRDQRAPVHHQAGIRVRGVDDRRRQVGVDRQVADLDPPRDARAAHLERHPDRLLVDVPLVLREPVLAVEVAVVGGVDDQRVVELARRPQRLDDLLDALVHRQQRLQLTAVLALDVGDLAGAQAWEVPDLGRLVGDVGLVEVRGLRQRLGVERMGVAGRRFRCIAAVVRRVRIWRLADVRAPCR